MSSKKQKPRKKNLADLSLRQRLLLGLRVGLISAAAMLGMIFLFVIGYGLIFPDKPLPSFSFRGGRPNFIFDDDSHRQKVAEPIETGFGLFDGPDGPTLRAGVEIHNPHKERLTPFHLSFEFLDGSDEKVLTTGVTIASMDPDETLFVSSGFNWPDPAPVRVEIQALGSDADLTAVSTKDLRLNQGDLKQSDDGHQTVTGTVENASSRITKGLAIHCVYYQDGAIAGGVSESIGQVFSDTQENWTVTLPRTADDARCNAIDRSNAR